MMLLVVASYPARRRRAGALHLRQVRSWRSRLMGLSWSTWSFEAELPPALLAKGRNRHPSLHRSPTQRWQSRQYADRGPSRRGGARLSLPLQQSVGQAAAVRRNSTAVGNRFWVAEVREEGLRRLFAIYDVPSAIATEAWTWLLQQLQPCHALVT